MHPLIPILILFAFSFLIGRRSLAWLCVGLAAGTTAWLAVADLSTASSLPMSWDPVRRVFAWIFSFSAAYLFLYGLKHLTRAELRSALLYWGGALLTVLAPHLLVFLVGWEAMSLASFFLVAAGRHRKSKSSALRYLMYHAVSGGLILLGFWIHAHQHGLGGGVVEGSFVGWAHHLVLAGILINAAAYPLHTWLTDAYPKATPFGSGFLSVFSTKTSVFALIVLFPGERVLIPIGVTMALVGVFYALLENHLRKLLSYHIISQVGFMVAAVGLGTELALLGAACHAFCHILYKTLLFQSVGVIAIENGREKLSDLAGMFSYGHPAVLFYLVGGLAISGVPLFNGYVSKSITIEAFHQAHLTLPMLLLKLAGIGTFLSILLKVPYVLTREKPWKNDQPVQKIPLPLTLGLAVPACLCVGLGVYPQPLYDALGANGLYHPWRLATLFENLALFLGAGLAFNLLKGWLAPSDQKYWDLHALDQVWIPSAYFAAKRVLRQPLDLARRWKRQLSAWVGHVAEDPLGLVLPDQRHASDVAREGTTIGWIAASALLTLFLFFLMGIWKL